MRPVKPDLGHLVKLRPTSSAWNDPVTRQALAVVVDKRGIEVLLLLRGSRKWIRRDQLVAVQ